ncbi:uncharacterized protein LOC134217521 [Armigeres subalbatus]|uniref:uncharacterized protein LOC134217521 n=1 Tax=Armigeres subalbatus TaxID=124917 RepID=UPI002ED2A93E
MKTLLATLLIALCLVLCTTVAFGFPVAQGGGLADISKMTVNMGDLVDPEKMKSAVSDILKQIQGGVNKAMESMPQMGR